MFELRELVYAKRLSYSVRQLMDAYVNQHEKIVCEAGDVKNDQVAALFLDMKTSTLFSQAKKDLVETWHQPSLPDCVDMRIKTRELFHYCQQCQVECVIDERASAAACPKCGISRQVDLDREPSFTERKTYNKDPRHVYAKREHFFQTLVDITCMGKRHIPPDIFNFCHSILGRGKHISFNDVFRVLQIGGYSKNYSIKYNIAAGLRGRPEINLTMKEEQHVRSVYLKYDKHFVTFQKAHGLGKKGISGRLRLFWPVRFIMGEIFKIIGREDLVPLLAKVIGPDRYKRYKFYWDKLVQYAYVPPPKRIRPFTLQLTRLPGKQRRQYPMPRRSPSSSLPS